MEMKDLDGDGKVTLEDYEKLIIESLAKCGVKIYERDWKFWQMFIKCIGVALMIDPVCFPLSFLSLYLFISEDKCMRHLFKVNTVINKFSIKVARWKVSKKSL